MDVMMPLLILAGVLATLTALILGIVQFVKSADVDAKRSNKLMQMRVLFQGLTVLVAMLFLAMLA